MHCRAEGNCRAGNKFSEFVTMNTFHKTVNWSIVILEIPSTSLSYRCLQSIQQDWSASQLNVVGSAIVKNLTWVLHLDLILTVALFFRSHCATRHQKPDSHWFLLFKRHGCLCCLIGSAVWLPRHLYDSSLIPVHSGRPCVDGRFLCCLVPVPRGPFPKHSWSPGCLDRGPAR